MKSIAVTLAQPKQVAKGILVVKVLAGSYFWKMLDSRYCRGRDELVNVLGLLGGHESGLCRPFLN